MTVKPLWQQMKDVVACEQHITSFNQELTTLQQALLHDKQTLAGQGSVAIEKKEALLTAQKNAKLLELEMTELKEAEDRKRKQLDNVQGQKEYKALEKEIETLSGKRSELEEQIIKLWHTVDVLKKEAEQLQTGGAEQTERLNHDIKIKEENIANLQQKLAQAQQASKDAFAQLPAEWQTQFQRMKLSVPDPIVPIIESSCSACFYNVLLPDLTKIKKGQVIVCKSCYRFLFYDQDAENVAKKAEY